MGRTPRETVIQQCYSDLDYALEWLPEHSALPTDELGRKRVSKSSALGLKIRIGLYEGTFQKYHGGTNFNAHLDVSIKAFEDLRSKGHDLFPDFNDVHSYLNEANATNKEIIFGKAYGTNDFSTVTTGHVHTRNLEGSYALTRNAVDQFLYIDGLPREKSPLKIAVETSFNHVVGYDIDGNPLPGDTGKRDPRLLKTIWLVNDPLETDPFMGWLARGKADYEPFSSQRPSAYQVKKAFFGSLWEQSSGNKDFTDKIIIRYAECLISYAEALYERNGSITDEVLDETVNKLRKRVGFDVELTNSFASANGLNLRDEIRRERYVELMTEGFRYDDIIRWKIAENVLPVALVGSVCIAAEMNNPALVTTFAPRLTDAEGKVDGVFVHEQPNIYVAEFANTRKFDPDRDYLYPIPTFEIAQSDFNIIQNPNWD